MNVDFSPYNDYELIYLYRDGDERATEILFWKYSFLINSRINNYPIPKKERENYVTEGQLALLKALKNFDEDSKMSFTSYFDLVLRTAFNSKFRREKDYYNISYLDDFDNVEDKKKFEGPVIENMPTFTSLENLILEELILNGMKPRELSKKYNIKVETIYNTRARVLDKLKKANPNER